MQKKEEKKERESDGEKNIKRRNKEMEQYTSAAKYRVQCGEPVRAHARIRTVRWNIIDTVR